MYLLPMSGTDVDTMTNGTMSREMSTVLRPVKLTIIYAHDCPEYERTVRHLVEYLNTQCLCDVRIDYLCASDIAANKFDWAYKSILEADRVVLLNSYGAYMRYQAKLVSTEDPNAVATVVERSEPGPFDDLFLLQLDLLTQESQKNSAVFKKFISIRFPFTSEQCVLPHANPYIRYELPKHFRALIIDVHRLPSLGGLDDDAENEASMPPQLRRINKDEYYKCAEGDRLRESIEAMTRFVHDRPNWFETLHIRKTVSTVTKERRLPEYDRPLLLEDRQVHPPMEDAIPKVPAIDRVDESESPLLEHGQERTKNYGDSVDSGVGVSSSKQSSQQNGVLYSPKHMKTAQPNGNVAANENDLRQRLIT